MTSGEVSGLAGQNQPLLTIAKIGGYELEQWEEPNVERKKMYQHVMHLDWLIFLTTGRSFVRSDWLSGINRLAYPF